MTHALITGPIQGRIPRGDGFVDVTPEVLYFDSEGEAAEVAEAIELEHAHRHTHPLQQECEVLGPLNDAVADKNADDALVAAHLGVHDHKNVLKAHQEAHKALNKKAGL